MDLSKLSFLVFRINMTKKNAFFVLFFVPYFPFMKIALHYFSRKMMHFCHDPSHLVTFL